MILNVRRTLKKSKSQMGFEPTTLRDLVGCTKHRVTGDSIVSKGQFVGLDWNRITGLPSQVMTGTSCFALIVKMTKKKWEMREC